VRCEWSHIRQGWEVRPASICGPDGGESLKNQFSMDGVMTKAPLGAGEKTGPNPTDRGKDGTKRSLLTDGAGVPVGLTIDGANRNDHKLMAETTKSIPVPRARPTRTTSQGPCLDKGYDHDEARAVGVAPGLTLHARRRGEEKKELESKPGVRARQWVVERTHGWMNRFRRILVRWEIREDTYFAMLALYVRNYRLACFGPTETGHKEIVVSPMVFLLSARATLKSLRDWTEIWLKSPLP